MLKPILLAICLYPAVISIAQRLDIYPADETLPPGKDFLLKVRIPGENWREVPVYAVNVADGTKGAFVPRESSMAIFDFSGNIEVEVTTKSTRFRTARIRPLADSIRIQTAGKSLHFTLDRPRNLSVELDGNIFDNLQIFAGSTEEAPKADTNTIYYGPGFHDIGSLHLTSGKNVFLAGGAIVEGQLLIDHQKDIRIYGHGILYQPAGKSLKTRARHDAIKVENAGNITIEGITVIPDSYSVLMGNSKNVRIKNLKSISAGGNNDGIDVFCSQDVSIDSVFMRNSDDCIAIYGHRWRYYGNTSNVTVSHSTLWADVAHPILVGTHGDPAHPDTLERLTFEDLDILDHHENQVDYQGCMSLNAGDSNLVRNVRFENIRVEDFRKGQLVNLRVMYNKKYNSAPGKGIENVLFKDVIYNGAHASLSIIAGYDESRPIRNIVFQNLRINGTVISDTMKNKPGWYKTSDEAGFFVGEHVDGLQFIK